MTDTKELRLAERSVSSVLAEKIERVFPELPSQLKTAARYLLDHPDQVAMYSMRELAKKAGVQPPTMTRLADRLGYGRYSMMRSEAQMRLQDGSGSLVTRARLISKDRRVKEVGVQVNEILAQELRNIQEMTEKIDVELIAQANKAMRGAKRIFVAGMRSMYPAAFAFNYACKFVSDRTILLDCTGGAFADLLRSTTERDVLIAFDCNPYANDIIKAVRFARSRGTPVIAVTDSMLSPIVGENTIPLVFGMAPSSLVPSVAPAMMMAQILSGLLMPLGDSAVLDAVERTETLLKEFCVFSKE